LRGDASPSIFLQFLFQVHLLLCISFLLLSNHWLIISAFYWYLVLISFSNYSTEIHGGALISFELVPIFNYLLSI
jgi:hypothetical protein